MLYAINTHLHTKKNRLWIHLGSLHCQTPTSLVGSPLKDMLMDFGLLESDIEKKFTRKVKHEGLSYLIAHNGDVNEMDFNEVSYKIPKQPELALKFLAVFDSKYIRCTHLLINPYSLDCLLPKAGATIKTEKLNDLLKTGLVDQNMAGKHLAEAIANSIRDIPKYKPLLAVINSLLTLHDQAPSIPFRFLIFMHEILKIKEIEALIDINQPISAKVEALLILQRGMISQNEKLAFEFILKELKTHATRALLSPAIGKLADDGKPFTWTHTEIKLFDGVISLRTDNQLSLKLRNNESYKENYAIAQKANPILHNDILIVEKALKDEETVDMETLFAAFATLKRERAALVREIAALSDSDDESYQVTDKKYAPILERELRHLANIIGIEIVGTNDDFHRDLEIVFTPATSKKLMQLGLHLFDKDYLQNLVKMKLRGRFFNQPQSDVNTPGPYFHLLPQDVFNQIMQASIEKENNKIIANREDTTTAVKFGRRK